MTLTTLQEWFGKTLSQPLQADHTLCQRSKKEAEHFIAPSPTLTAGRRMEIYHQQYWWRLLKTLQINFPTVTRLFGYELFQQKLAIPYLAAFPPTHWALCQLGSTFPNWLEKNYKENDHYLVTTAAQIDWAAQKAFWTGSLPPVDFAQFSPEETLKQAITLQLHIHLFSLLGDFFSFRDAFLQKEPEYYNEHPFPPLEPGDCYFVLYRTPKNQVTWKQISYAEYYTLSLFKEGSTVEEACEKLEEKEAAVYEEALSKIPFWFKQWTVLKWFGHSSS